MAIEFQNNFPMTLSSLPSPPHNCLKWPSMSFHLHPWNPLNCMDPWVSLCFIDMSILFLSTPLTSMLISVHPNCIVMFFKTLLTTVPFLKLCLHPIRLQYASQTRTRRSLSNPFTLPILTVPMWELSRNLLSRKWLCEQTGKWLPNQCSFLILFSWLLSF